MKITIVTGFLLPIPPVRGGAMEKTWFRLAREFVAAGHEVTFISRRWPGWPNCWARPNSWNDRTSCRPRG